MNPDPGTFIDAASRERFEAAHDFRVGVAPFGLIGQNDYSVHVVGHNNEGVQINAMVVRRQVISGLLHDRAHFTQSHNAVDDVPEEHGAIVCASRDEIRAGLRIIVAWQTQGAAAWTRVDGHRRWPENLCKLHLITTRCRLQLKHALFMYRAAEPNLMVRICCARAGLKPAPTSNLDPCTRLEPICSIAIASVDFVIEAK